MKTKNLYRFVATSLASACLLFSSRAMASDTVRFVIVTKGIEYRQTSATTVSRLPSRRLPYSFEAIIEGGSRQALAAIKPRPTIQLPAGSGFTSMYKERPALGLGEDAGDGWMFGYEGKKVFDNWGTRTKSELDSAFPPGSYVILLSGENIALPLPKDTYPSAPVIRLEGGRWSKGGYRIKPGKNLRIHSGVHATFNSHANGIIGVELENEALGSTMLEHIHVAKPIPGGPERSGEKSFSAVIKASRFSASKRYTLSVTFGSITSQFPVLAGTATALVTYETWTEVPIVVEPF